MKEKIDVQVKFRIRDIDKIIQILQKNKAVCKDARLETSIRYDDCNNSLSEKGIFIRTKSGDRKILTLKEKNKNSQKLYFSRIKTELEVSDIEAIKYVLEKIGLTNQYILEKYRLSWFFNEIELAIDELPFGVYLEVKGDERIIKKAMKIFKFQESEMLNQTYWEIFDDLKKQNKFKDVRNIRFEENHTFKISVDYANRKRK